MPRSGPVVFCEVTLEGQSVVLSYRERGTGLGGTIAFTRRGARTLARVLEGTCVTETDEPAQLQLVAKVRDHVQAPVRRTKPAA